MIGQVLRYRYEIEARIGEGPIFATYRGRDRVKNRPVVLKLLRPEYNALPEMRQAFKAYAESMLQMPAKPAIVAAWSLEDHEGQLFLVTEMANGVPLDEQIKKVAPMSVPVAVDIAIAIAEALDAVHRNGRLHGALKPTDIFVAIDGAAKVSDFGVRGLAEVHPAGFLAVQRAAAPYLAPEVASGGEPTPYSDVYSLGVILFEMLTGELPFPSGPNALDDSATFPMMRTLNPAVTPTLQELVERATARAPSFRYRTAEEMLLDLKAIRDSLRFGKPMDWSLRSAATTSVAPAQPAVVPVATKAATAMQEPPKPAKKMQTPPEPKRRPPADPATPRWHQVINLALTIISILAVMGFSAFLFLNFTKPNEVAVPAVVGKTVAEARTILESKRLKLRIAQQAINEHFPPDTIYGISPPQGTRVKEGSTVAVSLSLGPKMLPVPDVTGLEISKARERLMTDGFQTVQVSSKEYDDEVPYGHVIAQTPAPGRSVDRTQRVLITLSLGVQPDVVPPDGENSAPSPDQEVHQWSVPITVPTRRTADLVEVQVEFRDTSGTRIVYDAYRAPGEEFDVKVDGYGTKATVTVRIDGRRLYRRQMEPEQ